jgi:tetratricopeptide (TPR) repeat protein
MQILKWLGGGIIFVSLVTLCYAETAVNPLYGLRDKNRLEEFVATVESERKNNIDDGQKLKMLGIAYHNLASLKVKSSASKAELYLRKAMVFMPADQEIKAYLGSAMTMAGRDTWNLLAKMTLVHRGIILIDNALAAWPDSVVIRMVRANNNLQLPDSFQRKEMVKADFQYLEMLIAKSSSNIDADTQAEIFYQLGMLSRQENNEKMAKNYFEKVINAAPNSQWSRALEGALE